MTCHYVFMQTVLAGFNCAGYVSYRGLNLVPAQPPPGRCRHPFGDGPFAKLVMPSLPAAPGLYAWEQEGVVLYIGQTRTPLASRLGPSGYATITTYNTLARQPGRTNGGQQTNCRINALANQVLTDGGALRIWYRLTLPGQTAADEAAWMARHGTPRWNRRTERMR